MWVEPTPPMSAATAETVSSSAYHARSTGSADSVNAVVANFRNRSASSPPRPPVAIALSDKVISSAGNSVRRARNASRRACNGAEKKRRSSVTSIEVNIRNGLRASSPASMGRNAVLITGTADRAASRRS